MPIFGKHFGFSLARAHVIFEPGAIGFGCFAGKGGDLLGKLGKIEQEFARKNVGRKACELCERLYFRGFALDKLGGREREDRTVGTSARRS